MWRAEDLLCSETFLDLSTVESSEDELTTAGTGGAARDSVQVTRAKARGQPYITTQTHCYFG